MAEEKDAPDPEEGGEGKTKESKPKKGLNKKLLIIIIAAALVLTGAGVGAFLLLGGKGKKADTEHAEPAAGADHGAKDAKGGDAHGGGGGGGKSNLVAFEPFILNLAEQGRFLKMTMQLELASPGFQAMITDKSPQLRDTIITLVSSKSIESLTSPEGKMQLKDELLLRVNMAIGKDAVKSIYFTEFVMQ